MSEIQRVHIKIFGQVQGVLFRSGAVEIANKLKLTGWTKNTPEGAVEIVAEGEKEKLEKFIEWAKGGPSLAQVKNLKIDWQIATGEFDSFKVDY